jgi:Tfp pilus assembly protein PilP
MYTTSRHKRFRRCFYMACLVFLFGSAAAALAQKTPSEGQDINQAPIEIKKSTSTFEYQIEGRQDPFMPFLTERSTNNENLDEIIDGDQNLTGMQLFEPGQLTLVALMVSGTGKYAMVQDFTGKGYVIEEGTKIGRRGVVSNIVQNKVIIEEQALTRGGKTLINKIAMVLKKEGEE